MDKYTNAVEVAESGTRGCFDDLDVTVTPPATVRQVMPGFEDVVEFLTGRDLYITGTKKDGTQFLNRRVNNISFGRAKDGTVLLRVVEPKGGNRSFDWHRITDFRVAPPEMVWSDEVAK